MFPSSILQGTYNQTENGGGVTYTETFRYSITGAGTDYTTYQITSLGGNTYQITGKGFQLLRSAVTPTIISGGSGETIGSAQALTFTDWGWEGSTQLGVVRADTLDDLYYQTGTYTSDTIYYKNGSTTSPYAVGLGIHNEHLRTSEGSFFSPNGYYRDGVVAPTINYFFVQNGIVQSIGTYSG